MICDVPHCPAEAVPGWRVCPVHRYARTAKGLPLLALKKCTDCGRPLREDDWIYVDRLADGDEYQHVRCEPTRAAPRRVRKDDPKPLFEGL